MGDGMLAVFPSADLSFEAAVEMQDAYNNHELSITIGFHFGSVIEENGDVFGDAVNLAARIAAKARSGETLLTKETVDILSPQFRFATRFLDATTVKGKAESIKIYSIITEDDSEATVSLSGASFAAQSIISSTATLTLFNAGREIKLESDVEQISIGREEKCELTLLSPYASRQHAVISKQRDRFILMDQSTNGTYVLNQNNEEVFLKRESVQLAGSGYISLGEKTNTDSEFVVRYEYSTGK